ncbi:hypothetical protein AGABI2DRAFT_146018 [Agaricus bisporus var. bisporus H97]|uniref:hypothetical protein n=1 Tax=Agaricus bisporus var. bisporus (strain H97 / ATCC MYA-4626 / FGSC 10389) TaxID=936046 RepID=UPI00029F5E23|nr:hypothetical protein AGABI2DRAFT_146018 [Agaricus bisporus var. bisporus H97]EKV43080.1 hypothetical protein AGABI2DRAFT_146018 [Agaricus bisporus var. bisporus H97]
MTNDTKFYLDLKDIIATKEYQDYSPPPASKRVSFLLLITPLVFFSGFIVLNLLVVVLDPNRPPAILNYHKLYCTPKRHTGLYAGGTAMSIGMLMWTFILGYIFGPTPQIIPTTLSALTVCPFTALFIATIIIFCVFGTQKDITQAWAFWRKGSGENLGEGSFLPTSSFSATSSCPSMTAVYSETKMRGNWRRLGYNWNFRSKSQ